MSSRHAHLNWRHDHCRAADICQSRAAEAEGLAPQQQPGGDQFAAAAEFQVRPWPSACWGHQLHCLPVQCLHSRQLSLDPRLSSLCGQGATELLVPVDEIAQAFWEDTEWGQAMREQLDDKPFTK